MLPPIPPNVHIILPCRQCVPGCSKEAQKEGAQLTAAEEPELLPEVDVRDWGLPR